PVANLFRPSRRGPGRSARTQPEVVIQTGLSIPPADADGADGPRSSVGPYDHGGPFLPAQTDRVPGPPHGTRGRSRGAPGQTRTTFSTPWPVRDSRTWNRATPRARRTSLCKG